MAMPDRRLSLDTCVVFPSRHDSKCPKRHTGSDRRSKARHVSMRLGLERQPRAVLCPSQVCCHAPSLYPNHWRGRAEETRRLARNTSEPALKRRLLRIAEEYDALASQAENSIGAAGGAEQVNKK